MQKYVGLKRIAAKPMTLGEYCEFNHKDKPDSPEDAGYLVEYLDGGKANHPNHNGYISWSPGGVFEKAYKPVDGMPFGFAIACLKEGFKVARKGWNGKNMWLIYVPGSDSIRPVAGTPYSNAGIIEEVNICGHIDMFTAAAEMQPGWLASQADMLSNDWVLIDS